MLEQAGRRHPTADAVVDGRRRVTYAEVVDQATRLGHAFARLGVSSGDRVLIVLKNRLEHVLAYWALQLIGGVPTPAGFRLGARELRYILDDARRPSSFRAATADAVLEAAPAPGRLVFVGRHPAGCRPFTELRRPGTPAPCVTWRRRPLADPVHVRHHRPAKGVPALTRTTWQGRSRT